MDCDYVRGGDGEGREEEESERERESGGGTRISLHELGILAGCVRGAATDRSSEGDGETASGVQGSANLSTTAQIRSPDGNLDGRRRSMAWRRKDKPWQLTGLGCRASRGGCRLASPLGVNYRLTMCNYTQLHTACRVEKGEARQRKRGAAPTPLASGSPTEFSCDSGALCDITPWRGWSKTSSRRRRRDGMGPKAGLALGRKIAEISRFDSLFAIYVPS